MSLSKTLSPDNKTFTIQIQGKFDFNLVQEFRSAYADIGAENPKVVIDLRDTEYMDSSALGMLLNMQKNLGSKVSSIAISNCRPQIKKILQISRFDKKFEID
ncbi:STAS domain-containing protein [Catenovulum maritimum]|jgi:anti-anti-sigma factor|uniref:Anti-sigma factor antagonist n=1 Tax=Catenovulum maritimum TaxID=1513271 RepID=A0A0J8GU26_9ALTE|nr:STAS domain-containing protein [Catenovulum maritimum]KMT66247.1 anti-anti-sigma regulatory factor [Catenovulum maritimum]